MKRLLHLWLVLCTTLLALPAMALTEAQLKRFYEYEPASSGSGLQVKLTEQFAKYLSDSSSDTFDYGSGIFDKAIDALPNPAPEGRYNRKLVTSMKEMFMHSTAERLDCSLFDTRNVTDMENMFAIDDLQTGYKGKVITLDISNFYIRDDCKLDNFISGDSFLRVFMPDLREFGQQTVAAINTPNAVIIAMSYQRDVVARLMANGDESYKEITPYSISGDGTIKITEYELELFYSYEEVDGGLKVGLKEAFKDSLNWDFPYYDESITWWDSNVPLPNPAYGGMYKDKKVVSMEGMFEGCWAHQLDLSAFDTRYVKSMEGMFRDCVNLKTTEFLSSLNTESVVYMTSMFANCKTLTEAKEVGSLNMEKVVDISNMFIGCTSLQSVALPENTPKLKGISGLFLKCPNLREAHLNINTSAVRYMTNVFAHCLSLESIDLSSWNTSNVKNMRYMFRDCQSLKSLNISHFDMSNVTDASNMVYSKGLQTLYLPQWAEPKIDRDGTGSDARFYFHAPNAMVFVHKGEGETYKALSYIDYGKTVYCWDESKGEFEDVTYDTTTKGYKRIIEGDFLPQLDERTLSEFYTYTDYTAADGNEEMVKVGLTEAFKAAINAGNSFTCNDYTWNAGDPLPNPAPEGMYGGKKAGSLEEMFRDLSEVRTLDVSNFDTRYVEDMRDMFSNCAKLEEIKFSPLFVTENVVIMSHMFSGCASLTTLDLSDFDTHNVEWLEGMFMFCTKLQEITFSENFTTEKVKSMGWMFYNCTSLPAVDLSGFNTQNVMYFHEMFVDCNAMTTLDLSHFNLSSVLLATGFVTGENFERIFMPDLNPDMQYATEEAWIDCPNADVLVPSFYYDDYKELCMDDSHYKRLLPLNQIFDEDDWNDGLADENPGAIILRRPLSADYWNTFCVPFDISADQVKETLGEGTQIASYYTFEGNDLLFNSTDTIKAGVPYIIKPAQTVEEPLFVDVQCKDWYTTPSYSQDKEYSDSLVVVFNGNLYKTILIEGPDCEIGIDGKLRRATGTEEERYFKGMRAHFSIYEDIDVTKLRLLVDGKSIVPVTGDVNDDGQTTMGDAQNIINFVLHLIEGIDPAIADVNGDGEVTVADAQALVNMVLSKLSEE